MYQGTIPHYRRPIYEELGHHVDLTIAYTDGNCPSGDHFKAVRIRKRFHIPMIGYFHTPDLIDLVRKTEVLISPFATQFVEMNMLKWIAPNAKQIRWGIGVEASYNSRYDSLEKDERFISVARRCDAALFYSEYPKEKYSRLGVESDKMFIAHNTVVVENVDKEVDRKNIIFVGTLYAQKRVDLLLEAYSDAFKEEGALPDLIIVGDGDQKDVLIGMTKKLGIDHKVRFTGRIEDETVLSRLFSSSIACISPDQAGLTVLKSMGYGVPFVTLKNAITGGEIFNIQNGINGVLMDSIEELSGLITDIGRNKKKYVEYGQKAYEHYHNHRTPKIMVDGFLRAIDYVVAK